MSLKYRIYGEIELHMHIRHKFRSGNLMVNLIQVPIVNAF